MAFAPVSRRALAANKSSISLMCRGHNSKRKIAILREAIDRDFG